MNEVDVPVLDYKPRLDERNLAYRVTAASPELLSRSRYWTPGAILNQQAEGACVGFGVTAEAMASPVRNRVGDGNVMARGVYRRCLQIDEFEGERDEGTSVRAGMLVGRERGWWTGFRWALNMNELRAALEEGPVVIGVEWREGMYEAPRGTLTPLGPVVGGHCILVTGYSPNYRNGGPFYRLRNSWGPSWGINGSAYITAPSLQRILFGSGGEAAVAIGRKA